MIVAFPGLLNLYLSKARKTKNLMVSGVWYFKCAYAIPHLGYRHAFFFFLKLPQGLSYMSATSLGSGETVLMRRLA